MANLKDQWLPRILMVEIETQTSCNRVCCYCPNSKYSRPYSRLDLPLLEKIFRELAELNFCGRVSFHFYNEPLLDERLPDIVGRVRSMLPAVRIVIYSNGDFLDLETFRLLVRCGCDLLLITVQENAVHDNEWIKQLSFQERQRLIYQTHKNPRILYTNRGGLIPWIAKPNKPLAVPCTAPATTLVIPASGNVILCYEDYLEKTAMGNLANDTIANIWTSKKFSQLRSRLIDGDRTATELCKSCNNKEHQGYEQTD